MSKATTEIALSPVQGPLVKGTQPDLWVWFYFYFYYLYKALVQIRTARRGFSSWSGGWAPGTCIHGRCCRSWRKCCWLWRRRRRQLVLVQLALRALRPGQVLRRRAPQGWHPGELLAGGELIADLQFQLCDLGNVVHKSIARSHQLRDISTGGKADCQEQETDHRKALQVKIIKEFRFGFPKLRFLLPRTLAI